MEYLDDFNTVPFYLVENHPILEVLHRPAAKTADRWLTETAWNANSWHICQGCECAKELIEEAFCDFQPGLRFEVIKLRIDFAPREWADRKTGHLLCN